MTFFNVNYKLKQKHVNNKSDSLSKSKPAWKVLTHDLFLVIQFSVCIGINFSVQRFLGPPSNRTLRL